MSSFFDCLIGGGGSLIWQGCYSSSSSLRALRTVHI